MTQLIRTDQPTSFDNQLSFAHQIQSDQQLIHLWLHSEGRRSERTREEYRHDISQFQDTTGLLLRELRMQDILDYQLTLSGLAPSTQARRISSLKSLLSFGHKLGYLPVNVGKVITTPAVENKLSERILSEEELFRILSLETNPRNLLLLKVFYVSGGRVSETVSLRWRNLQPRESGGQITFFGKGGKTRVVLIPENLWNDLQISKQTPNKISKINHDNKKSEYQKDSGKSDQQCKYEQKSSHEILEDCPVFISQKGSQLSKPQAWRIVRAAAVRAGIAKNVSPHWFRHAHASHALDNGAPIHLVSETLGHSSIQVTSRYSHARPNESSSNYLKIK